MNPALTQALIELEQHVAKDGLGPDPRLFALVDTAELIAAEPRLAAAPRRRRASSRGPDRAAAHLYLHRAGGLPADTPLDEMLAGIAWPATVHGARWSWSG